MNKADFVRRVRGCERRLYRVARTLLSRDTDCVKAEVKPCSNPS